MNLILFREVTYLQFELMFLTEVIRIHFIGSDVVLVFGVSCQNLQVLVDFGDQLGTKESLLFLLNTNEGLVCEEFLERDEVFCL